MVSIFSKILRFDDLRFSSLLVINGLSQKTSFHWKLHHSDLVSIISLSDFDFIFIFLISFFFNQVRGYEEMWERK